LAGGTIGILRMFRGNEWDEERELEGVKRGLEFRKINR
jgi:hypothetical protein